VRSLSCRQRLFIEYYLGESSRSPVDAARRAGYRSPERLGPRLVKHPAVQAAIDVGEAPAAMTSNEVLARLADVAAVDLLDFVDVDRDRRVKVDLKLVKRLGLGYLIKRLRIHKDGTQEIELEPKVPALIKLGEQYKLWKGEAQSELTLVDLAKGLEEQLEQYEREGQWDQRAKDFQEEVTVRQPS
jgi:hypothetical protein